MVPIVSVEQLKVACEQLKNLFPNNEHKDLIDRNLEPYFRHNLSTALADVEPMGVLMQLDEYLIDDPRKIKVKIDKKGRWTNEPDEGLNFIAVFFGSPEYFIGIKRPDADGVMAHDLLDKISKEQRQALISYLQLVLIKVCQEHLDPKNDVNRFKHYLNKARICFQILKDPFKINHNNLGNINDKNDLGLENGYGLYQENDHNNNAVYNIAYFEDVYEWDNHKPYANYVIFHETRTFYENISAYYYAIFSNELLNRQFDKVSDHVHDFVYTIPELFNISENSFELQIERSISLIDKALFIAYDLVKFALISIRQCQVFLLGFLFYPLQNFINKYKNHIIPENLLIFINHTRQFVDFLMKGVGYVLLSKMALSIPYVALFSNVLGLLAIFVAKIVMVIIFDVNGIYNANELINLLFSIHIFRDLLFTVITPLPILCSMSINILCVPLILTAFLAKVLDFSIDVCHKILQRIFDALHTISEKSVNFIKNGFKFVCNLSLYLLCKPIQALQTVFGACKPLFVENKEVYVEGGKFNQLNINDALLNNMLFDDRPNLNLEGKPEQDDNQINKNLRIGFRYN